MDNQHQLDNNELKLNELLNQQIRIVLSN